MTSRSTSRSSTLDTRANAPQATAWSRWVMIGALAGVTALAACSREGDNRTAGEKVDQAVATAEQKTETMKNEVEKSAADAKASMSDAAAQAKAAGKDAANRASNAMSDAAITTKVNAELAKDPKLSAMKIDVDTDAGRVELKGTAPDSAARDRATQLARNVEGVVEVDNQLSVDAKM